MPVFFNLLTFSLTFTADKLTQKCYMLGDVDVSSFRNLHLEILYEV